MSPINSRTRLAVASVVVLLLGSCSDSSVESTGQVDAQRSSTQTAQAGDRTQQAAGQPVPQSTTQPPPSAKQTPQPAESAQPAPGRSQEVNEQDSQPAGQTQQPVEESEPTLDQNGEPNASAPKPAAQPQQAAGASSPVANQDWFRPEASIPELINKLKDKQVSDRWIYHDIGAAREQARQTGKPILALFRCVPCESAPGLDGALCTAGGAEASAFEAQIQAAGGDLDALLDQFVTVRVVKMNGVNRNVFQFDRDVPYVTMVLNADGTVYGRYGTRVSKDRKNLRRHNLPSFQRSLERALELHRDYPNNKSELAAKRRPVKTPAMTSDMDEFKPFPEKHNYMVKAASKQ